MPLHTPYAHVAAVGSLFKATAGALEIHGSTGIRSLLANNFNRLWCEAINKRKEGIEYFAMLHGDISAEEYWLDKLFAEMDRLKADIVSAVVPLKDDTGCTSTAIGNPAIIWGPRRRLTLSEVHNDLPPTFNIDDCVISGLAERDDHLLVNTGCWLADICTPWADLTMPQREGAPGPCLRTFFSIADAAFEMPDGTFKPCVSSEDWTFSRMAAMAQAKVYATRTVKLTHFGEMGYPNDTAWGRWSTDTGDEQTITLEDSNDGKTTAAGHGP